MSGHSYMLNHAITMQNVYRVVLRRLHMYGLVIFHGDANIGHVNLLRCPSPTTTTTSSSFEKQLRKFSTYKLVTVAVVFVVRFCFLSPCFDSPNAQLKISFIRASDEYQIKITKNVIHCILSKYRMTFQLEIFISQAIRSIKNLMYFPARCWVRRNDCRSKDCLI